MLKRVRDFAQVMNDGAITAGVAHQALDRLEVDELGLDMVDRRMLEAMIRHYNGGPVGLDTLAAVIGEESVTIEDVYEPYPDADRFYSAHPPGAGGAACSLRPSWAAGARAVLAGFAGSAEFPSLTIEGGSGQCFMSGIR